MMHSIKLSYLARKLNAKLYGNSEIIIYGISSINSARTGCITFLADSRLRRRLSSCQASAIIITEKDLPFWKGTALVVKDPYLAYARVAQIMDSTPNPADSIDGTAIISSSSVIGNKVAIGAHSVVGPCVYLGDNVRIGSGCFIGEGTCIKSNTTIWANVTIYHNTAIGKNCLIQSGSVVGSDGFGYVNYHDDWIKIPQLGKVVIEDHVEIGSCTTIDRGSLDDTFIGKGVIIDNQCQIAHNVSIGNNTAIAGGVIIAGSVTIGKNCMIGGASVINGHISICNNAVITGMSMVMRSISKPGVYSSGIPVQENKEWRKTAVSVMNIRKMNKRIKNIEEITKKLQNRFNFTKN